MEAGPTSREIVQAGSGEDIEDPQIVSLLIALGAAMALLVVHYWVSARRPLVGVITVLPVGLVLALTFGAMAVTGPPLDPVTATLAALTTAIGFGILVTSTLVPFEQLGYVIVFAIVFSLISAVGAAQHAGLWDRADRRAHPRESVETGVEARPVAR